jgi:ubiquitin-protein ligase
MSAASNRRAVADIAELQNPLYRDGGIHYHANEENMLQGYACIFGPEGTPYMDCPMLYEVTVPTTFPFDPPQVQFRTYDGHTRFHPNMYIGGKCCLSILHTWQGPKWASTMRLSTVLVTLQSLMDSDPLRHEPGYEKQRDELARSYKVAVEVGCTRWILGRAECLAAGKLQPSVFEPFIEEFQKRLPATLDRLEARLQKCIEGGEKVWPRILDLLEGSSGYAVSLQRVLKLKAALNTGSK